VFNIGGWPVHRAVEAVHRVGSVHVNTKDDVLMKAFRQTANFGHSRQSRAGFGERWPRALLLPPTLLRNTTERCIVKGRAVDATSRHTCAFFFNR
jgi:hypothetical protein